MTGLSQVLTLEDALGVSTGHEETLSYVERYLEELERNTLATAKRRSAGRPSSRRSR
jgi:hypothetical protein